MSATSQVTTFSDLFTDLQNRVRVTTGVTATENQAKRYINTALQDIALGTDYKLPWMERRAILLTHATYTTGTVTVAAGATAVTGASTLWNTANTYGQTNVRTTGRMTFSTSDIYDVTTVTSDTAIVISPRYVAGSNLSAGAYTYFEDQYALAADFLRPVDAQLFTNVLDIPYIGRTEFRRRYPRPNVTGRPRVACILDITFGADTVPIRYVQFYPAPNATYVIPYDYITSSVAVTSAGVEGTTLSADTDEPTMPLRYRHLIVLHALYNWYRDKKDDARSQEVKAEYTDGMLRLTADAEIGTHTRARIQPRQGFYTGHATRPYRRSGRRGIDANGEFDRLET